MTFQREHQLTLFLPPELHLALIKYQAQKELGRPYAGLLLITKQIYQEKLITKELYDIFVNRYSRKLVPENFKEQEIVMQKRELKVKLENMNKTMGYALQEWGLHNVEWKIKWIEKARSFKDQIPNANLILEKEEKNL